MGVNTWSLALETKTIFVREPAYVEFHLDGGFTRVRYERIRIWTDIKTESIPIDLRSIGSKVLVTLKSVKAVEDDNVEAVRAAIDAAVAVEAPDVALARAQHDVRTDG